MESALRTPHTVFEGYCAQLLLDGVFYFIKAQQAGPNWAILGPFQGAVVVQASDNVDGLGELRARGKSLSVFGDIIPLSARI